MLLFWLCGALAAAVIVWLLLELSSAQKENYLLRRELMQQMRRMGK